MDILSYKNLFVSKYPGPWGLIGEGVSTQSASKVLELFGFESNKDFFFFSDSTNNFSSPEEFLKAKLIRTLIVSPGYPLSKPWIQSFAQNPSNSICSELTLGALGLDIEKVIAVTGSLGKSTTVSLLGYSLSQLFPNSFAGGNLGTPLCDYILKKLSSTPKKQAPFVVLELSSYQLENCAHLYPDFSAITYLSPNHLERYPSLNSYYDTKWKLVDITRSKVFLNKLGGDLFEYSQKHPNPKLVIVDSNTTHKSLNLNQSKLIGAHNHQNIALAAEILLALGIQSEDTKTLLNFAGLKHRLQYLGQNKAGIHFVNDSKATAIESVDSALTATAQDPRFKNSQIFLLLGGKDKNLPWSGFKETLSRFKNVTPVFFGYSGKIIQEALNSTNSMYFNKLEEAVRSLVDLAKQPDVILLSPGGTSLDEFKNFEDRGLQFEIYCKKYFNLITNESTG